MMKMDVIINGRRFVPEPARSDPKELPGVFLCRQRNLARLSLDEAAGLAGISKTYLWELEHDKAKDPSFRVVVALADLYSIDLASFAMNYRQGVVQARDGRVAE